jgi:hypothetical protein
MVLITRNQLFHGNVRPNGHRLFISLPCSSEVVDEARNWINEGGRGGSLTAARWVSS